MTIPYTPPGVTGPDEMEVTQHADLLRRARYWIIEDIAAGAEADEEHLLLIAELCDALEGKAK